jgi:hypothetical protein
MSNIGLLPLLQVSGGVQLGEELVLAIPFTLSDGVTPLSLAGLTLTSTFADASTGDTLYTASTTNGALFVTGTSSNLLTWAIQPSTIDGWPGLVTFDLLASDGTYSQQVLFASSAGVGAPQEWSVRSRKILGQTNPAVSQSNAALSALSAAASAASALAIANTFSSLAPVTANTLYANALAIPPIEAFATRAGTPLVGDGETDDSAALVAAHANAFAAGVREVFCAKTYYAPSAYNIGEVLMRGPGALVGTYRKKIVDFSARASVPRTYALQPAIHLRRFAQALVPTVVFWGDSTTTYLCNEISKSELLCVMIERAILRDNPGRTINFVNLAIGGTGIIHYNYTGAQLIAAGITLPAFFTDTTKTWLYYLQQAAGNLYVVNFGANDSFSNEVPQILNGIAPLQALPSQPDIILVSNLPRSTQADALSATVAALEQRDLAAGATRSVAESLGLGLIDLHRYGCAARDGYDPVSQIFTQVISSPTSMALPATLPSTQSDFDLSFQVDNTGGVALPSASVSLQVTLSAGQGNALVISNYAGAYWIEIITGGGRVWLPLTVTTVAIPNGLCNIEIAIRGSMISLYFETVLVFEGLFQRAGSAFQPVISYKQGAGATSINVVSYASTTPTPIAPSITDAQMFGNTGALQGGNTVNHPASPAYENIHALALEGVSFCAADAGVAVIQPIAAAGAIASTLAGHVELTGGASGSYAITLAAPTALDIGRFLTIEMVATTGGAVTLALTNVYGAAAAATSYTWSAAGQTLTLRGAKTGWIVVQESGGFALSMAGLPPQVSSGVAPVPTGQAFINSDNFVVIAE